jgi:hypothetical protein
VVLKNISNIIREKGHGGQHLGQRHDDWLTALEMTKD